MRTGALTELSAAPKYFLIRPKIIISSTIELPQLSQQHRPIHNKHCFNNVFPSVEKYP